MEGCAHDDGRCAAAPFPQRITVCLAGQELSKKAEEVVDLLGCYFPIVFKEQPGRRDGVPRAQLSSALQGCLAAAPALAPHVVPLLLSKLCSTLT